MQGKHGNGGLIFILGGSNVIKHERTLIAVCLLVALLALSCNTAKGGKPNPPATGPEQRVEVSNNCQNLLVYYTNAQGTPISVGGSGVACEHGYYLGATPSPSNVQYLTLTQSSVYGPDCNMTVQANNQSYTIRAQQNYCFLSAGNVTASVVAGNAVITGTQEGSYGSSLPGKVWVKLN